MYCVNLETSTCTAVYSQFRVLREARVTKGDEVMNNDIWSAPVTRYRSERMTSRAISSTFDNRRDETGADEAH